MDKKGSFSIIVSDPYLLSDLQNESILLTQKSSIILKNLLSRHTSLRFRIDCVLGGGKKQKSKRKVRKGKK